MKKLIAILVACLSLTACNYSEWELVSTSVNEERHYIKKDTLETNNNVFSIVVKSVDLKGDERYSVDSISRRTCSLGFGQIRSENIETGFVSNHSYTTNGNRIIDSIGRKLCNLG